MTLALAWLRSRRLIAVAVACAVVALAGMSAADATLRLPGLRRSLPLSVIVVVVSALVVTTPLCNRFGGLEASMPRARLDRAMAGVLACGLAVLACLPVGVAAAGRFPWSPLLALMTIGVLAVIALGPLGWMPPTVLSLVTLYVDFNYAEPIRSALDAIGLFALSAALVASVLAYAAVGPRSP